MAELSCIESVRRTLMFSWSTRSFSVRKSPGCRVRLQVLSRRSAFWRPPRTRLTWEISLDVRRQTLVINECVIRSSMPMSVAIALAHLRNTGKSCAEGILPSATYSWYSTLLQDQKITASQLERLTVGVNVYCSCTNKSLQFNDGSSCSFLLDSRRRHAQRRVGHVKTAGDAVESWKRLVRAHGTLKSGAVHSSSKWQN